MPLKPPRPPASFRRTPDPTPPPPPPQAPNMMPYAEQPGQMAPQGGYYYPPPPEPPSAGSTIMRNIAGGFFFAMVFGGIFSLIAPRNTKITIDHANTNGPLTPEQLRASVPLHSNRMVNFEHVNAPSQQYQPQQQSMLPQQQSYQRGQLPPPVALPQYQTGATQLPPPVALPQYQNQQNLYQAPPPQSYQQPPQDQH